jgi:hypothetical protein
MTLTKLRTMLDTSRTPRVRLALIGKVIGSGSQRKAYQVGAYVVKANTAAWELNEYPDAVRQRCLRVPNKALRAAGVRPPKVWYAGKNREWVIQPFYGGQGLRDEERIWRKFKDTLGNEWENSWEWQVAPGLCIGLDLAPRNLGLHPVTGELVAFDW